MTTRLLVAATAMLVHLARFPTVAFRSESLAVDYRLDGGYVRRLLARLGRAGLVTIIRGPMGGTRLARLPSLVTLLDIEAAVRRGPAPDAERFAASITRFGVGTGLVGQVLAEADGLRAAALRQVTLADLVERSKRTRHAKYVLSHERQNQIRADRRHLVEPGLPELPLDVVLVGKAEAAEGLEAGIGRLP